MTGRDYEDVVGTREDLQLQVGPTLSYGGPALAGFLDNASMAFSLPVTYTQNFSTVAKNSWHGVVAMPTISIAFQPPVVLK